MWYLTLQGPLLQCFNFFLFLSSISCLMLKTNPTPLIFNRVNDSLFSGQFTPPREVLYRRGPVTYLDRKAISYNHRLEVCRLAGLAALCTAALMILLSFLLAAYSCPGVNPSATGQEYCPVLAATQGGGIPLSGVLTTVQPSSTPIPSRR